MTTADVEAEEYWSFDYDECDKCDDRVLKPCIVFMDPYGSAAITLCQEHLMAAAAQFDGEDFRLGSPNYVSAQKRVTEMAMRRRIRREEEADEWLAKKLAEIASATPEYQAKLAAMKASYEAAALPIRQYGEFDWHHISVEGKK